VARQSTRLTRVAYGVELARKTMAAGVEGAVAWPGHPSERFKSTREFLLATLGAK
jgi:hypothetical protein